MTREKANEFEKAYTDLITAKSRIISVLKNEKETVVSLLQTLNTNDSEVQEYFDDSDIARIDDIKTLFQEIKTDYQAYSQATKDLING